MADELEDDDGPDELLARASMSPGAPALDPELVAEWPAAWLGTPGRAAPPAAGPRAVRRAAASVGAEPRSRHNWVPIGPRNVAGRMRAIVCGEPGVADPQLWFAASAGGGVWRTRDAGRRWEPLPDWHDRRCLVVGALAVAPTVPTRIYAATGEASPAGPNTLRGFGVFVSTNGGDSWDNFGGGTANPVHRGGFEAIAVDPGDALHAWAVGVDGAFRTLNGGVTWDPPYGAGTFFSDVAFTSNRRLVLVRGTSVAGEAAVLRLNAPAAAVAAVTAELASADALCTVIAARPARAAWPATGKLAIATAATAFVRFADEDERHLGLFRTTNLNAALGRSMTWTRLADHPDFHDDGQAVYDLVLAVEPGNPKRVVTGQVYLHVSTNADAAPGAVSWRRIMSWPLHRAGLRGHHADQHGVTIAGGPPQLWVANDGGIARATPNWSDPLALPVGGGRPVPPGTVGWERRDSGIQGAQAYDLAQSPLVRDVLATGLQDHGTYLRTGGQTWRPIMGGDGAYCTFDPDDPYRLAVSFYGGLTALQFPALRDQVFADEARDSPETATRRMLVDGLDDDSVFVPETARDPLDTGRLLHARRGRLYGLKAGSGERFALETVGRSFVLRVRMPPAPGGPRTRLPKPLRFYPPTPPEPRVVVEVVDTPGARRLGLLPGRGGRFEHVDLTDHDRFVIASRLPAPYRLVEGDELRLLVDGVAHAVTFRAADGIDLAKVTVADIVRKVATLPVHTVEAFPSLWRTPSAVQLVTHDAGAATLIRLGGDALDPLPDGLSRLAVNRGDYHGDAARPASVLLNLVNLDLRTNRDFSGPVRTLQVTINGGAVRSVRIEPPAFPDPANVTAGQLAAALAGVLAGDPVHVHAVPSNAWVALLSEAGTRVVLSGTAAARLSLAAAGAPLIRLGVFSRTVAHLKTNVRNYAGIDLTPTGPPLQLVISDGTAATPPLLFTAADVADLRAVTVEELHTLISRHLAATPAVRVRADLVVAPAEGWVSELQFGAPPPASPGGLAAPSSAWAGGQDGSVYVTRDGGVTWLDRTNPQMRLGDREVEAIAVHPTDPLTAWVGLSGEAAVPADSAFVFRTSDGGETWQPVGHHIVGGVAQGIVSGGVPLGVHALELDPADPAVLFAATDAGVFRSTDSGDSWAPINEGLPNAQVVDLVSHPEQRVLRAALWTRGAYERRLDADPPDEVRLLVRNTELDDGFRPARAAPSFGTAAAGTVPTGSPDLKVVRRRPAGLGTDADVDGVTFDLDLPHDDIVAGSAADVMVQVTNTGPVSVPPPGGLPAERARVVLLWAPLDDGIPVLPADIWTRLTAPPPLAGALGAWTVGGDSQVPRTVPGGDTGVVTFPVAWPALDGTNSVGLLVLTTAVSDPLTSGPTAIPALLAVERRVAFREVAVRRVDDDRTLVVRATGPADIVVENVAAAEGTSAGIALGFAAGDLGVAGRVRVAAVAPADDRNLAAAGPGPALGVRLAAPLVADLTLLPAADEARAAAAVQPSEVVRMLQRRIVQARLPIGAYEPITGFVLEGTGGATLRAAGTAAAPLGFPVGGPGAPRLQTSLHTDAFALAGATALTITVLLAGGNVAVPVDLSPTRFSGTVFVRREYVARAIIDDLRLAGADGVVNVRLLAGVALDCSDSSTMTISGPAVAAIGFAPVSGNNLLAHPGPLDLRAGPVLHVEVTPRAVIRFDGDPADIPDLTHARHADIRRAISLACELTGVPAKAEVASIDLRVAASPEGGGRRHPVLGGAHLAELAATPAPVAVADRLALFTVRAALGHDVLKTGAANSLYLRVRNTGTVDSVNTRLRLFRLDLAATPITATEVANATPPVPAGSTHIEEFTWDPGGVAPRSELLLCVADDDRAGRRTDVPATFATHDLIHAFAGRRPGVALRLFDVVA
ncbi:hypothetical protein [Streptomyces sp. SID13031]|uniref:hypothetical protein n=1 Tax=Streptomyces sp. SID13031 TaxID=2706046 RepID=UPI0013CC601F|nr:hypothetical protein [Streptomyces sp. SID13031]NEA30679.1 hypothetical protein [Streptomyces sp. SID13031]